MNKGRTVSWLSCGASSAVALGNLINHKGDRNESLQYG